MNRTAHQSKTKRIIVIGSIIFGIISIISELNFLLFEKIFSLLPRLKLFSLLLPFWKIVWWILAFFAVFSFYGGMFLFPIIGLILGIITRKSKLGIVGILLSVIGLMGAIYLALVFYPILQQ